MRRIAPIMIVFSSMFLICCDGSTGNDDNLGRGPVDTLSILQGKIEDLKISTAAIVEESIVRLNEGNADDEFKDRLKENEQTINEIKGLIDFIPDDGERIELETEVDNECAKQELVQATHEVAPLPELQACVRVVKNITEELIGEVVSKAGASAESCPLETETVKNERIAQEKSQAEDRAREEPAGSVFALTAEILSKARAGLNKINEKQPVIDQKCDSNLGLLTVLRKTLEKNANVDEADTWNKK